MAATGTAGLLLLGTAEHCPLVAARLLLGAAEHCPLVAARLLLGAAEHCPLVAARLLLGTCSRLWRCQSGPSSVPGTGWAPGGSRGGLSSVPAASWALVRSWLGPSSVPGTGWAPGGSRGGLSSMPAASCPQGGGLSWMPAGRCPPGGSRGGLSWMPAGRCPPGGGLSWMPAGRCPPGGGLSWVPAASCPPGGSRRGLHCSGPLRAGHNRWSKVRTVKGPQDAARSKLFQRLALRLRCAAREGGPEPALNPQLARVVQQCRAHNMPKGTIEAAIRGGEKASAGTCRLLVEARGPGGCQLLLELLSANPGHSLQQLRLILARHGGSLAEAGARQSFEEQGVVRVAPRDRAGAVLSLERALELALELGAQDVVPEEEEEEEEAEPVLKFLCVPSALRQLRASLEASGLCPLSACVEFLPRAHLQLPPELCQQLQELLSALSLCPELLRLYHNSRAQVGTAGVGTEGVGTEGGS